MSYREKSDFDRPTAETVEKQRREMLWVIPLVVMQQGMAIFRHDADKFTQLISTAAWAAVTLVILWLLLGFPLRWLSERDRAIVNDEWAREVSGDAARWGIAALALIGCGLMVARVWLPLDAGMSVYGLVNGAILVAVLRYAWLNRVEPAEDE